MFDFENKLVKDWTLAEAKEYCKNHRYNNDCISKDCILKSTNSCIGLFADMTLKDNTILKFTTDEIAFCRLIKKTYPWANYVTRNRFNDLKLIELFPIFDEEGRNKIGTTGCLITIQPAFFPQIKPLTYYAIDDIIKQGENNNG